MELYGTPASGGAAVGRVYRYLPFRPEIVRAKLPPERVPAACRRLEEATGRAVEAAESFGSGGVFLAKLAIDLEKRIS